MGVEGQGNILNVCELVLYKWDGRVGVGDTAFLFGGLPMCRV